MAPAAGRAVAAASRGGLRAAVPAVGGALFAGVARPPRAEVGRGCRREGRRRRRVAVRRPGALGRRLVAEVRRPPVAAGRSGRRRAAEERGPPVRVWRSGRRRAAEERGPPVRVWRSGRRRPGLGAGAEAGIGDGSWRVASGEHLPRPLEQLERAVGGRRAVLVRVQDEAEAPVPLLDGVVVVRDRLRLADAENRVPAVPLAAGGGVDLVCGEGALQGRERRQVPLGVPGHAERAV